MPDFGIFRGFNDKLFGNKLYAGQLPTQLGLIGSLDFGFDADAQAFFNRVIAAGGTLSLTEQLAIDTLVRKIKTDGIWTKMKAIYPMVGASSAACSQNLKSSSFTGTFNGGWTFASTGVTPNGSSGYMNTGISPSTLSQTSNSMSVYVRNSPSSGGWDLSSENNAGNRFLTIIASFNGGDPFIANNSGLTSAPSASPLGLTLNTRIDNVRYKIFRNNSLILNSTTTTTGLTDTNFLLGARLTNTAFSNKNYSFAHIGDGLTDTEASNFYTAVQAFQTTLSRQV
jgi:hypothetical protein